jgi:hypothetical protein
MMVIRRYRESRMKGSVEQYFAINERADGLGRVADERRERPQAGIEECFKFPLGVWSQGETRTCRESTIQILELDYVYECVPHSLKFRWKREGMRTFEGIYIFAPDRGMILVAD